MISLMMIPTKIVWVMAMNDDCDGDDGGDDDDDKDEADDDDHHHEAGNVTTRWLRSRSPALVMTSPHPHPATSANPTSNAKPWRVKSLEPPSVMASSSALLLAGATFLLSVAAQVRNLRFYDTDSVTGSIGGTVYWEQPSSGTSGVKSYAVFLATDENGTDEVRDSITFSV